MIIYANLWFERWYELLSLKSSKSKSLSLLCLFLDTCSWSWRWWLGNWCCTWDFIKTNIFIKMALKILILIYHQGVQSTYHHQKWRSRHHCRQPGGGTEDRPELLNASNCVTWGFHMFYVIFYKTWYMLYLTNGLGQTLIFQTRLYENPKSRPTVTLLQRLLAGIYLKWW